MDDELKKALTDILNDTREAASQGKDFVLEQAPLVVQEYVAYTLIHSAIMAVASIVGIGIIAFAYWRLWKAAYGFRDSDADLFNTYMTRATAGIVVAFCVGGMGTYAASCASTALKASVAPRVLILEKAAELVK